MEQLYILQCNSGKYYVGKTTDVIRRFEQHKTGNGCAWTKKYKPIRMIECRGVTSDHDENNVTKDMMKKYGIENVRGGTFCQIVLPETVVSVLQMEFRGTSDTCYKCNLAGHLAKNCSNKKSEDAFECTYCERTFTTKFGRAIHEKSCKDNCQEDEEEDTCYRCGRGGHYLSECYASYHADGSKI